MAFWLLSRNIRRVRANADMRALGLGLACQSGEGAESYQERLVLELGTISTTPTAPVVERDEEGFADLKAMAAAM